MEKLRIELIEDPVVGGFTARVPDIPAYGEGETEDAAIADLKEAIAGYIETYGMEDAAARVSQPQVKVVDWTLETIANG